MKGAVQYNSYYTLIITAFIAVAGSDKARFPQSAATYSGTGEKDILNEKSEN